MGFYYSQIKRLLHTHTPTPLIIMIYARARHSWHYCGLFNQPFCKLCIHTHTHSPKTGTRCQNRSTHASSPSARRSSISSITVTTPPRDDDHCFTHARFDYAFAIVCECVCVCARGFVSAYHRFYGHMKLCLGHLDLPGFVFFVCVCVSCA